MSANKLSLSACVFAGSFFCVACPVQGMPAVDLCGPHEHAVKPAQVSGLKRVDGAKAWVLHEAYRSQR
jgi:hypothetical protein